MPAFDNPVFESAAKNLAALRQPGFAEFSSNEVDRAMSTVMTINGPNQVWLSQLKSRVQELSFGTTRLEDASPAEFPFRAKTLGASYHTLHGLFKTCLVIITPSNPPFQFVSSESH